MTIVGAILSLVLVFFSACWYYLANKNKEFYKSIPGPPPVPIFGNTLAIKTTQDILPNLMKYIKQYGGIIKLHRGPIKKSIIVSDYKMLECILSSTKVLSKSGMYGYLHQWLGTGLLISTGEKWRKHRRILTPAFHFQILGQFLDVFHSGGNTLVEKLKTEVGKDSVDIYPYVTLCALDIICETAMGVKVNAQDEVNSLYVQSVKEMCRIVIDRSVRLLQMSWLTYPLTQNYYTEKKCLEILHNQTKRVIKEKREKLKNQNKIEMKEDGSEGKKRMVFLDLLLQATKDGRPLTNEEIREEVDTFMFEGHDTTASAMSFALYALACNPEAQVKAVQEQKEIFGDVKDPVPTYAHLQSMKYLEQIIKETLRIYPTVPIFGRQTTQPVEFDGKIIPAGVTLNMFPYGIHHNPEYFENPEIFDPSRFENIEGKLPYSFIPFSAGPRNCIGQKFAMLEMKSTLSKVLRNFELLPASPVHKVQLIAETVLKSANGIKIGLKLRN